MESNIILDITKFRHLLESKKSKGQNMKPPLEIIGQDLEKETQLNFKRKKDPDGAPWKELAPNTKKSKIKRGRNPNNILRDKGLLLNSIHNEVGENYALVAPGKEVKYARIHQKGGQISQEARKQKMYWKYDKLTGTSSLSKKKKATYFTLATHGRKIIAIPKRTYIGITDKMAKRYMKIVIDYLKED